MEYIKALPVNALIYFSISLLHKSISSIGSGLITLRYRKNVVSVSLLLVIIYSMKLQVSLSLSPPPSLPRSLSLWLEIYCILMCLLEGQLAEDFHACSLRNQAFSNLKTLLKFYAEFTIKAHSKMIGIQILYLIALMGSINGRFVVKNLFTKTDSDSNPTIIWGITQTNSKVCPVNMKINKQINKNLLSLQSVHLVIT